MLQQREVIDIPFHVKCKTTSEFPRHSRKVDNLEKECDKHGIETRRHGIEFEGSDNLEVIDHTKEQVERIIHSTEGMSFLRFALSFGDGGVNIFISALLAALKERELKKPLIIYAGGTMSNLANSLKTADPKTVAGIIRGHIKYVIKQLRIREAEITIYKDEEEKHEENKKVLEWTSSAGLEFGGEAIRNWETLSRKNHPLANLVRSVRKTIKDTVQRPTTEDSKKEEKTRIIKGIALSTLPKMGPFTLPIDEKVMESDDFVTQKFESPLGREALSRIGIYLAIGANPKLSQYLWSIAPKDPKTSRFPDFWRIVSEIKPEKKPEQTFRVYSDAPNMHLDGTTIKLEDMGLNEENHAKVVFRSTKKSIPVVQAIH